MKSLFIIFTIILLTTNLLAQEEGDYRSKTSGNWGDISTWERYNGTSWENATTTPTSSNNVTITSNNIVTIEASPKECNDLDVNSDGKLWVNSTFPKVLMIYGNISCNGNIGNGETYDAIIISIAGESCTISGNGNFNARSLIKNTTTYVTSTLTIDMDVNLRTN